MKADDTEVEDTFDHNKRHKLLKLSETDIIHR